MVWRLVVSIFFVLFDIGFYLIVFFGASFVVRLGKFRDFGGICTILRF